MKELSIWIAAASIITVLVLAVLNSTQEEDENPENAVCEFLIAVLLIGGFLLAAISRIGYLFVQAWG